jgi:S1-C subfamily serine protease
MDPFSRGEDGEQDSPAPSNPPEGNPGTSPEEPTQGWQNPSAGAAPEASSEGWQTPPPDAPPPPPSQGYGAQGASQYGQQYRSPGSSAYGTIPGYPGYGTGWDPQAQQQPRPRHGARTALLAVAVVAGLMVLVVGFGGGIGAALLLGHGIDVPTPSPLHSNTGNGGSGNGNNGSGNSGSGNTGNTGSIDLSKLASQLDPAIVDINGVQTNAQGQTVAQDAGTGVIITSSGVVLTNNHVIEGNSSMTATLANGQTVQVKVLGEDPSSDVALLQLEGVHNLPTINIQNGATASVGAAVAAFGNALGQGGTPASSQGSVTATDQSITASLEGGPTDSETLSGMIEESAQICAGDSGGVLANAQGQYLGMLTAASSQDNGGNGGNGGYPGSGGNGGYPGSGGNGGNGSPQSSSQCSTDAYVIPASKIIPIVKQIESGKRTQSVIIGVPGFLGVEVDDQSSSANGAQVSGLVQGGPAAQAGLPQTFVITAIDGQAVTSSSSLSSILQQYTPGTTVQVTWNDGQGGASQTTSVTLGSGPPA